MASNQIKYQTVGRRKSSVARITMIPGTGTIKVNNCDVNDYMPYKILVKDLKQPLVITETEDKYDVLVNVKGGGFNGQSGAIRLGLARALILVNSEWKSKLKKADLIRRDARIVERKKYGFKKARKSPQFSKR